jgi:predicted nucleic-acid-binding Zn-ribbon protein
MEMKEEIREIRVCPLCGNTYAEPPALSRTDNETLICPDCGTRQALESIGISAEEQEKILSILHRTRE